MTEEEMLALRDVEPDLRVVGPDPLGDRTLLFGYDVDRLTWHVYQQDDEIHLVIYRGGQEPEPMTHVRGVTLPATDLVPNKRLYPDGCDYGFCRRLKELGVHMTFTNHGAMVSRPDARNMVGLTAEDLDFPGNAPATGR